MQIILTTAFLIFVPLTHQASKYAPVDLYDTTQDCLQFSQMIACTDCDGIVFPYPGPTPAATGASSSSSVSTVLAGSTPASSATSASTAPPADYEVVSCNFPGTCPDGVSRSVCTWYRYLSFQCYSPGS